MAVGNNNGTYSVPEGLRGAVQAPGFAYVMQGVQNWNAPRREELDREREQRTEAKRTIESGLNTIRVALASPNLSDAERSKLLTEQMNLEGLQTQLSTGFGGVNVQGILATATAAATSASTMASGIAAGGYSSAQMAQIAAQAGVSTEYARAFGGHVVTSNMTAEQARETVFRGFEYSQRTIDHNNQRIVAAGGQLAGTEEERARWAREEAEARQNKDTGQLERVQRERLAAEQRALEDARAAGQPQAVIDGHKSNIQTYERRLEQIAKQQQIELNQKVERGEITPQEAKEQQRRFQDNIAQDVKREVAVGDTAALNASIEQANDVLHHRKETQAGQYVKTKIAANATATQMATALSFSIVSTVDEATFAFADEETVPVKKMEQQTAALDKAKEAAKPLAKNGAQATEATQGQTEAPRTQTAAVAGKQNNGQAIG